MFAGRVLASGPHTPSSTARPGRAPDPPSATPLLLHASQPSGAQPSGALAVKCSGRSGCAGPVWAPRTRRKGIWQGGTRLAGRRPVCGGGAPAPVALAPSGPLLAPPPCLLSTSGPRRSTSRARAVKVSGSLRTYIHTYVLPSAVRRRIPARPHACLASTHNPTVCVFVCLLACVLAPLLSLRASNLLVGPLRARGLAGARACPCLLL